MKNKYISNPKSIFELDYTNINLYRKWSEITQGGPYNGQLSLNDNDYALLSESDKIHSSNRNSLAGFLLNRSDSDTDE